MILFKIFRLSTVQEKRPVTQPLLATNQQPAQEDKRAVLENIQSIVPNHDARLQGVEVRQRFSIPKLSWNSSKQTFTYTKSEVISSNSELSHQTMLVYL